MSTEHNDALSLLQMRLADRLNELQHLHDECRAKLAIIRELSGVVVDLGATAIPGLSDFGSMRSHKAAALSCYEIASECRRQVFGDSDSAHKAD